MFHVSKVPELLETLCRTHGFEELARRTLPSLTIRGLWQRLRFDAGAGLPLDTLRFVLLAALRPLLRLLPGDISLQLTMG